VVRQAVARLEAEARTVEHELSAVQAAMTELNTAMDAEDAMCTVPPDVALRQAVGQSRLAGELSPGFVRLVLATLQRGEPHANVVLHPSGVLGR